MKIKLFRFLLVLMAAVVLPVQTLAAGEEKAKSLKDLHSLLQEEYKEIFSYTI